MKGADVILHSFFRLKHHTKSRTCHRKNELQGGNLKNIYFFKPISAKIVGIVQAFCFVFVKMCIGN
jgi:hypothetical protein